METIRIGGTDQHTTRLGFGCSSIVGGFERRRSLALLETAFDAGIRHFDVAPMYGFGTAEEVVGEFLQRHAGNVTVTTKFGVLPERRHPLVRLAYGAGRRLLGSLRGSKGAGSADSPAVSKPLNKVEYTTKQAATSLENSLRKLRVQTVDLLLMHEASADELQDGHLATYLRDQVNQGRIRNFGVGSTAALVPDLLRTKPEYCNVIQSEWSAADEALGNGGPFRITHRALQGGWKHVYQRLACSKDEQAAWSDKVGVDLGDKTVWPKLLLRAALTVNSGTIVLFSTRTPERIFQNITAAQDVALTPAVLRLHNLLRADAEKQESAQVMGRSRHVSLTSGNTPQKQRGVSLN